MLVPVGVPAATAIIGAATRATRKITIPKRACWLILSLITGYSPNYLFSLPDHDLEAHAPGPSRRNGFAQLPLDVGVHFRRGDMFGHRAVCLPDLVGEQVGLPEGLPVDAEGDLGPLPFRAFACIDGALRDGLDKRRVR